MPGTSWPIRSDWRTYRTPRSSSQVWCPWRSPCGVRPVRSGSQDAMGAGSAGRLPDPAQRAAPVLCLTSVPSWRSWMVWPQAAHRPLPSLPASRGIPRPTGGTYNSPGNCWRPGWQRHSRPWGAGIYEDRRAGASVAVPGRVPAVRGGPHDSRSVVGPAGWALRWPRNTYSLPGHHGNSVLRQVHFRFGLASRCPARSSVRNGGTSAVRIDPSLGGLGRIGCSVRRVSRRCPSCHREGTPAGGPWPRSTACRCMPS